MRPTVVNTKTPLMALLVVLFAGSSLAADTEVPHVFSTGDVIRASDMNDNFTAVLDAVDNVVATNGAQGVAGATGAQGVAGSNGVNGIDGINAVDDLDLQANLLELFARIAALESLHAYKVGDTGPGGGFVFYVNPDEPSMGLEVSLLDQGSTVWCSNSSDLDGVVNTDPGIVDPNSGVVNTATIINACGASSAASMAANYVWPNGQIDGFLPNMEELQAAYQHKDLIGGFTYNFYWSSSEYTETLGRGIPPGIDTDYDLKGGVHTVRAVRAFNRLSD
jgi:hypothetical protein